MSYQFKRGFRIGKINIVLYKIGQVKCHISIVMKYEKTVHVDHYTAIYHPPMTPLVVLVPAVAADRIDFNDNMMHGGICW